jgi:hypothetical protein
LPLPSKRTLAASSCAPDEKLTAFRELGKWRCGLSANTATGNGALTNVTTSGGNSAIGFNALHDDTIGFGNTAVGAEALGKNTAIGTGSGHYNTATGQAALLKNTVGSFNTADGRGALVFNTTGDRNSACGDDALGRNTTGSDNVGIGHFAGVALTTGDGNVCIGAHVPGVAGEGNTTRIRNVYSSLASLRAVYVDADNKIGTVMSSRRFKDEIKPMEKASETILALKPVTFRYKKEIDVNGTKQFGLVAEEGEKVNPELVTRDENGDPETVRYDAVNAMLLNEFLKEHRKVEQLTKDFESKLAEQQTQIQQLTAGLQKVSAQLEVTKPASQTVLNNQ